MLVAYRPIQYRDTGLIRQCYLFEWLRFSQFYLATNGLKLNKEESERLSRCLVFKPWDEKFFKIFPN
jgi:hypothetical protein